MSEALKDDKEITIRIDRKGQVHVYINGSKVGCMTELNLRVKSGAVFPQVEMIFPTTKENHTFMHDVKTHAKALKDFIFVDVKFNSVDEENMESDWSSSEEDFQKSLDMVKNGKES